MRRAQVDESSQIHRNLGGNPAFNHAGTTQVIRTNRCLNPSFEASTGNTTIRTNLVTNPRGVFAYADYTGANQTITANVAITGHPDGITTANRVTYTTGAANPGVTLLNPLVSGTQYTATAWVYHETIPTGGTQGLAQAGIASQSNPPAITQGVWVRLSWTFTASGTSQLGFRVSSQTGGGSFLITGAMVEANQVLDSFFDGATSAAGDFTYGWNGTANASTSYQRGTNAVNWTAATMAGVYQTSIGVYSGTKSGAVRTNGNHGDGVFASDIAVVVGTKYTWSAWIKTTSVHALHGSMRWKNTGQGIIYDDILDVSATLVVGSYVRVSMTAVAPANAVWLQPMWRILSSHTPTTFYVDAVMLEDSPVLRTYFDGSTAAAGDYTYAWSGAANTTTSLQRTVTIPWVIASKSSSVLDAKFFAWQSTAEDGKKTLKYFTPSGTPNSSWRVAQISGQSPIGWDVSKVKAGGQYTFWMRYRTSGWAAASNFYMQIADGNNANTVVGLNSPGLPLNATGWQEYRRTFTALRDATTNSQIYVSLPTTPPTETDGIFEIREWMLVEGEYTGDYIDGTKPFSKWDGTADQSSSIGYPQQLLDIAGKPILDYSTAGTYVLDDSFGPQEARSFYTVVETLAENPVGFGVSPILHYGDTALSDTVPNTYIQLRQDNNSTQPDGRNSLFCRRTGANGVISLVSLYSRHVSAWGINNSGQLFMGADGGARVNDTQVMSIPHQKMLIQSNDTIHNHIRTIGFRGLHDTTTAAAISRYLGNKYGAAVA